MLRLSGESGGTKHIVIFTLIRHEDSRSCYGVGVGEIPLYSIEELTDSVIERNGQNRYT